MDLPNFRVEPGQPHGDEYSGRMEDIISSDGSAESMAIIAPKPTSCRESLLELLPPELRETIYQYLLVSHHVKEPSLDLQEATYRFHPAILRTNRAIAREARRFLYRNKFVVVSTNMREDFGPLWSPKIELIRIVSSYHVANFKEHLLQVDINISSTPNASYQDFLMVADDLPRLCRFLRMIILKLTFMETENIAVVRLHLQTTVTLKSNLPIQKLVLDPFKQAHGKPMRAFITGDVDASYRREVLTTMMPSESRTSVEGWAAFQLCKETKREGDAAYLLSKWALAVYRYKQCFNLVRCCNKVLLATPATFLRTSHGMEFAKIIRSSKIRTGFNALLGLIQMKLFGAATAFNSEDWESWIVDMDPTRVNYCRALIFAECGMNRRAAGMLEEALQRSPENVAIKDSLELVKNSPEGFKHLDISRRALDGSIREEGGRDEEERERSWQKMGEACDL